MIFFKHLSAIPTNIIKIVLLIISNISVLYGKISLFGLK